MSLVTRIKELCDGNGITIDTLCNELGFGTKTIYKWDKNSPSIDKLQKVAEYFQVSLDYLTHGKEYINPTTGKPASALETKQLEKILEMEDLVFMGAPLTEDDKEKIKHALELAFWDAKEKNKRKK